MKPKYGLLVAFTLLLAIAWVSAEEYPLAKYRAEEQDGMHGADSKSEYAILGGGCFWCVEAVYERIAGVKSAVSGYAGGTTPNPSYNQVTSGATGHAEVVRVEFDPDVISYSEILEIFFKSHDPTTLNRQGPDVGTQYRSAIFYADDAQRAAAESSKSAEDASGKHSGPIVTEITKALPFYPAEDYHQQYLEKRGLASCHIQPQPS